MDHHIQAYFKSENDAESAAVKLKKINTRDELIDSIPGGGREVFVVPAFNFTSGATASSPGMIPAALGKTNRNSSEKFTHILEFKISSEELSEALDILGTTEAHIDEESAKQFNE
ncbi:hypothetical protein [Jeotgalibacillus proteolyticus]|uniref:Uncharacterized protein n=1 Tax=Jeotgalibacillus proteolyticus TaxID=2082395 RepID=A0A2S5GG94_9BACL|nr:hypothetical protein [Jeotgalibacillus proteolyticus]PPA71988.1 hypothetical protein C4B60_01000 [Jeotgalibacillus proteolyticus]